MKKFQLSFLLLFSLQVNAQQNAANYPASSAQLKQSDASLISITKYDSNSRTSAAEKPILITGEDKKQWTRPVYQNPNYHKVMPNKDPNEVLPEDKD